MLAIGGLMAASSGVVGLDRLAEAHPKRFTIFIDSASCVVHSLSEGPGGESMLSTCLVKGRQV